MLISTEYYGRPRIQSWEIESVSGDASLAPGHRRRNPRPCHPAKPISTIYDSRSGWYLFSLIPIVPAELPDAMKLFVEEARLHGADGVARIKVEIRLSSFFTAWSPTVALTGECYKKR